MSTSATVKLLGILLLFGAGFIWWQQAYAPDQLSNDASEIEWQPYIDAELGFSLEYPADWTLDPQDSVLVMTSPETIQAYQDFLAANIMGEAGPSVDVVISYLPTLAEFAAEFGVSEPCITIKECLEAAQLSNGKFPLSEVLVDGITGYRYTLPGLFSSDFVVLEHQGVYEWIFLDRSSEDAVATHMLASFKFLD